MKQQRNEHQSWIPLSRRDLFLAALVGGSIAVSSTLDEAVGAEPPVDSPEKLSARVAVERLVHSESRVVRLKPTSRDFAGVVVQAIAVDPRGQWIAVAGDDHVIRIIDVATLTPKHLIQGHSDLIQSLHFDSSGNQLVSAGNDGQLILWNRNADFRAIQRIEKLLAWACIRFAPDDREIAAVGFENRVHLFRRDDEGESPEVTCDCTDLRTVDYRHDGKLFAVAGRSGDIYLFDRETSKQLHEQRIHTGRIHSLRFTSESPVMVSVGEDGCVVMYDTAERAIVRSSKVVQGKLYSVCILDHQHLAVAGSDNMIRIVNVTSGKTVQSLEGHTGTITALESMGNLLFSGGYDTTLRCWELRGLEGVRERIAERENPIDR